MPRKRSKPKAPDAPTVDKDYWGWLEEVEHAASQDYDKTVLSLATATLAFSVTFAHEIASRPVPGSTRLLASAWILLFLSAVAVLGSLFTTQLAARNVRRDLEAGRDLGDKVGGLPNRLTDILTPASGVLLAAGLLAFLWFALANLP
jgi:hypothetical protein